MPEPTLETRKKVQALKLEKLLPSDLNNGLQDVEILRPEWAFLPDEWSFAFQRGLKKLDLNDKTVWEVGGGTGLNLILMRKWFPEARLLYSDYDFRATNLSEQNLEKNGNTDNTRALTGVWDLVQDRTNLNNNEFAQPSQQIGEKVDYIVACIPQVPREELNIDENDNRSHYFDPRQYQEANLKGSGLELNEALLVRARQLLEPGSKVVLNLGGRPGKALLLKMFEDNNYEAKIIHEEVIPQHQETSLQSLVDLEERTGCNYEFFTDESGQDQITAKQAEQRRKQKAPLYHKIYVIEGTLKD